MRILLGLALCIAVMGSGFAQDAAKGLATIASRHSFADTLDKIDAAVKAKGMKVFTHIDHAAAATEFGQSMPRTTVVVFGNPAGGTPNFLKSPTLAIDLPLKALVWQDASGKTSVTYNTGAYIVGAIFPRHGLSPPADAAAAQEQLLADIAQSATQ